MSSGARSFSGSEMSTGPENFGNCVKAGLDDQVL